MTSLVEALAEVLAKADGWLALNRPSPATQQQYRDHAAALVAAVPSLPVETIAELAGLTMVEIPNGDGYGSSTMGHDGQNRRSGGRTESRTRYWRTEGVHVPGVVYGGEQP